MVKGSANVVCHVPSYFQALLELQASKHFQQVVGPPKCAPGSRGAGALGVGGAGIRTCLESGFSSAFPCGTYIAILLRTGQNPGQCGSVVQVPAAH